MVLATNPELTQQPRYSDDGKFYWDGEHWAPVQSETPAALSVQGGRQSASPARAAGIVTLVGSAGAILGTFLPWVTATGPFGISMSKAGMQTDGIFVAIAALVPAGIAGLVLLRRRPSSLVMGILVLLVIAQSIALIAVGSEINGALAGLRSAGTFTADFGAGIYVSGLGTAIAVVGVVMAMNSKASVQGQEHSAA